MATNAPFDMRSAIDTHDHAADIATLILKREIPGAIQTDVHTLQPLSFRPQGEICFASIYDNSRFLPAVEMTIF